MAKLLLVEDDNNLREIYEARLQAEGYVIVSAQDGEEALVIAKAEKPDLIISDVMMPKISGFEMLDILRNTEGLQHVKVIMLTALGQSDDQHLADKLGADRYMVKSQVTLEDIVKVTHELLGDGEPADTEPTAETASPEETIAAELATSTPDDTALTPPADDADASDSATGAQSTVQEEADVHQQIENFVAGASSEPTAPAAPSASSEPPAPEPELSEDDIHTPPPEPTAASAPVKAEPPVVTVDDTDASSGQPAPQTPSTPPLAPDVITPITAPSATPAEPANDKEPSIFAANKKIIQPLSAPPQKDIHTLLALEEAKAAAQQAPVPATVVVATDAGLQTAPASGSSVIPSKPVVPDSEPEPLTPSIGKTTSTMPHASPYPADNAADPHNISL